MSPTLAGVAPRVLKILDRSEDPLTAREIADMTIWPRDRIYPALRGLHARGLAQPAGTAAGGARCWAITAHGSALLATSDEADA